MAKNQRGRTRLGRIPKVRIHIALTFECRTLNGRKRTRLNQQSKNIGLKLVLQKS